MADSDGHFATVADNYLDQCERFPLSWIRPREIASVRAQMGDVAGASVLDLGCGAGFYARMALAGGARRVVGVDAVPAMVAALPAGIEGVVGDALAVRLGERFDVVICAGLIEFVPDAAGVLRTIAAHMAEGGRGVILWPPRRLLSHAYKAYHLSHGVRIRLFGKGEVAALAAGAGLRLENEHLAGPIAATARLAK